MAKTDSVNQFQKVKMKSNCRTLFQMTFMIVNLTLSRMKTAKS